MRKFPGLIALVLLSLLPNQAFASEAEAKKAKIMWSAFECSQYATLMGNDEEAARLFEVGYDAGQEFLTAANSGAISDQEAHSIVPVGVLWLMSGPTNEFVIGRIFERAGSNAFDNVTKEDANGLPLEIDKWALDDELRASIASNRYARGNCDLL